MANLLTHCCVINNCQGWSSDPPNPPHVRQAWPLDDNSSTQGNVDMMSKLANQTSCVYQLWISLRDPASVNEM